MLFRAFIVFLMSCPAVVQAQKNALGISVLYGNFTNSAWDGLQDIYHATFDTIAQKHPYLRHLPGAGLTYERQLTEYLYAQPFAQYQYARTQSTNGGKTLDLKAQFISAGVGINWYPVKMATGQRKSVMNPLYLRCSIGTSYAINSITLDNKVVYDDSTQSARSVNLTMFAEGGLGYDLHFGSRLVFQPYFGFRLLPAMDMQSMAYFIESIRRYDLEDAGLARELRCQFALFFLF